MATPRNRGGPGWTRWPFSRRSTRPSPPGLSPTRRTGATSTTAAASAGVHLRRLRRGDGRGRGVHSSAAPRPVPPHHQDRLLRPQRRRLDRTAAPCRESPATAPLAPGKAARETPAGVLSSRARRGWPLPRTCAACGYCCGTAGSCGRKRDPGRYGVCWHGLCWPGCSSCTGHPRRQAARTVHPGRRSPRRLPRSCPRSGSPGWRRWACCGMASSRRGDPGAAPPLVDDRGPCYGRTAPS
jgi:hypothetical protein